jgi:glutamine cyclotransferase
MSGRVIATPVTRVTAHTIKAYSHDAKAFTQGLTWLNGQLYEGTGLYGHSQLRRVDLDSGSVRSHVSIARRLFGEGICVLPKSKLGSAFQVADAKDEYAVVQITWKSGQGFVYGADTLQQWAPFTFHTHTGEGWGLTYDDVNNEIWASDGSDVLHVWDPSTLKETRRVRVHLGGKPLGRINELEWIDGKIWANVWFEDTKLFVIDPATGSVTHEVMLPNLRPASTTRNLDAVLNGIAWDHSSRKLYLTGKLWPKLYHVEVPELLGTAAASAGGEMK